MRAVFVEVVDVDVGEPDGVRLVKHDDVIEEFAAAPTDPALRHRVLPPASIGSSTRLGSHRLDELGYRLTEDRVTVEDQILSVPCRRGTPPSAAG